MSTATTDHPAAAGFTNTQEGIVAAAMAEPDGGLDVVVFADDWDTSDRRDVEIDGLRMDIARQSVDGENAGEVIMELLAFAPDDDRWLRARALRAHSNLVYAGAVLHNEVAGILAELKAGS